MNDAERADLLRQAPPAYRPAIRALLAASVDIISPGECAEWLALDAPRPPEPVRVMGIGYRPAEIATLRRMLIELRDDYAGLHRAGAFGATRATVLITKAVALLAYLHALAQEREYAERNNEPERPGGPFESGGMAGDGMK